LTSQDGLGLMQDYSLISQIDKLCLHKKSPSLEGLFKLFILNLRAYLILLEYR